MNELSTYITEQILLDEDSDKPIKKTIVVYSGRFQPFHSGHYHTYSQLVKKFGKNNVYIGTSDKTDSTTSPFNFKEKFKIITTMFNVPKDKVVQIKNPYKPVEVLSKFDKDTTAYVTAVGEKDASRLGGKYFQKYDGNPDTGYETRGYIYISPKQSNPISGTDVRNNLSIGSYEDKKKYFEKTAYTKFNPKIFDLVTSKLEERLIITKDVIEEWLLNESSAMTSGQADDGPGSFTPNYDTFKKISAKRAAKIGYEVINMIMTKELEDYYEHPKYPHGPTAAVSYFPAGVIGAKTTTNQFDVYSSKAYTSWFKHVTRTASLAGYSLVYTQIERDAAKKLMKLSGDDAKGDMISKSEYETSLNEIIKIPVEIGDTILTGKFKNKKTVVKSIGEDEHGMPIINGKKVVTFRFGKKAPNIFESIVELEEDVATMLQEGNDKLKIKIPSDIMKIHKMSEMAKSDLDKIEKYAEKQLSPEDIEFGNHFFERLNDKRNGKDISVAELTGFFKRLAKHKKQFKEFLEKYQQLVVKDKRHDINIPFMTQSNQIIAKTIMRKKDFKTPNKVITIESTDSMEKLYADINSTLDSFSKNESRVLVESPKWTSSVFDLILDGYVPLTDSMMKRILGDINVKAWHSTDLNNLGNLVSLQGKKKSISTFDAADLAGSPLDGTRMWTDGNILVLVYGTLLARNYVDLMSKPDKHGRRWIWPKIMFGSDLDMTKLRDVKQMKSRVDKGEDIGGKEKAEFIKSYIDKAYKQMYKNRFHFMKTIIENGAKLNYTDDWNEVVMNNIMILHIYIMGHNASDEIIEKVKEKYSKFSITVVNSREEMARIFKKSGSNLREDILTEGGSKSDYKQGLLDLKDDILKGKHGMGSNDAMKLYYQNAAKMLVNNKLIDNATRLKLNRHNKSLKDLSTPTKDTVLGGIDIMIKALNETIKKVDGKYVVYPKKGGDRLGTHDTYKDALKQLQAIEASKAKNESVVLTEGIDYVTCKECGKRLTEINSAHLRTHDMTRNDYTQKHPNSKLISEKRISQNPMNNPVERKQRAKTGKEFGFGNKKLVESLYDKLGWTRPEDREPFKLYQELVRRKTNDNYQTHFMLIESAKKRSKDFHLDHKYSISDGFKNNIPIEVISHYKNLEIINGRLNESKGTMSNILLKDLINDIQNSKHPLDKRMLLTCGGAYGHLAHPFETEINLTFGQLKDIVNKGLDGELEVTKEKCISGDSMLNTETHGDMTIAEYVDNDIHDKVLSYNEETDTVEYMEVMGKFNNDVDDDWLEIELEDGKVIQVTPNHKIYVEGLGYMRADKLTKEMNLKLIKYDVKIKSIKKINKSQCRYDIKIDNYSCYYANGILIHNTDGQALAVSWRDGKLIAARNKGHLKNRGENALDISGVADKFKGRGGLTDAYNFAMTDLNKSISKLTEKQRLKIFNEGESFMNLEVIWPESVNVIPYGQALLVFHSTMQYDMDGNAVGQNVDAAKMLAGMIKQVNADVQSNYKIQGPPVIDLPKTQKLSSKKGKYTSAISKLQKEFKLKDSDGVASYHQAWWSDYIDKNSPTKLDKDIKEGLVKRWAFFDKSFRLNTITDDKTQKWADKVEKFDLKQLAKNNLMKFEDIFLGLGADILEFTTSILTVNPDEAVRKMKDRVNKTIEDVKNSNDPKKIEKLKLELRRLNAVGGMDKLVPNEGIVFTYNGHVMKLSGKFASLNQLLGIFF